MSEVIEKIEISEVLGEKFGTYSKYIIQDRALPDVRDGLKPVQRRILYMMHLRGNTQDKPYRKSAAAVGDVMGKLHPHGDSSIYEAMSRMSQEWKMGMALVDFHGNNGSIDGDSPAAMRYTDTRLQKIASEGFMSGINKDGIVPMINNYDDTMKEPVVLPASFPNILVNGVWGISSGYGTDIAPHNFTEVLKGCILLINNPDTTLDELLEVIPAPDFPTGGVVVGAKHLRDVYAKGKGKIVVRSKYHIEKDKKRKYIIIDEIPYDLNKTTLVKDLQKVADSKKVEGFIDARDESDRKGLRVAIELHKDADENIVLGYLFKNTQLQKNYNLNMVVVKDKKPKLLGLREILVAFNDFRIETRTKELRYDKKKTEKRLHIVEGFIKLVDILDEVIAVIKESDGKSGAKKDIIDEFGFSDEQAEEIVKLQLYRISKTDKKKYDDEKELLTKKLNQIIKLLESPAKLRRNIAKGYEKLIENFGVERRTEVVQENESWDVTKKDIVKEEDVYVGVSKGGYIKRSSSRSYSSATACGLVEGDELLFEQKTNTKHSLLLFTNKMNYMYIPVHEIEEAKWGDTGKHIASYGVDLGQDEKIVTVFTVSDKDRNKYILIAKTNGQVKRTAVSEYEVVRKFFNLYMAVKQKDNEELAGAWLVDDSGYIAFEDKNSKRMYFAINEVAPTGLKTKGMRGIHLEDESRGINQVIFCPTEEDIPDGYKYRERGKKGWA
ncbi:DNA topoisomerase (ATP-hydrolyzing) subunit A [Bacillus sp. 1006-3]|uniref:DNA gyrase/topoisomerase IV subunit A n=1 Tax=Bacillus sp. 1006-3 TaxID=2922309 RepID=UPI001F0CEBD1|nr:DNA topoisomerase (ATP-hydrolyzing) [Bacillus sp. 1006-3]MCH4866669.1 DNA topoisomerase 4 subunit A [Bacillus sp. 1006-3]